MFSLFKSSPPYKVSDKIWMTEGESFKGLATEGMMAITRNEIPLIVFWFDDVKNAAFRYFDSQNVPYVEWSLSTLDEASLQRTLVCVSADQVLQLLQANLSKAKSPITILFPSHHPLIQPEELLLSELHKATGAKTFTFFLSLDGPLLEVFSTDNMRSILEKLGIKQDECIEHSMVSRSIFRAREKISSSVRNEIRSDSEKEWYSKNVRKG